MDMAIGISIKKHFQIKLWLAIKMGIIYGIIDIIQLNKFSDDNLMTFFKEFVTAIYRSIAIYKCENLSSPGAQFWKKK